MFAAESWETTSKAFCSLAIFHPDTYPRMVPPALNTERLNLKTCGSEIIIKHGFTSTTYKPAIVAHVAVGPAADVVELVVVDVDEVEELELVDVVEVEDEHLHMPERERPLSQLLGRRL